ncbi:hypothetical protein EAF00_011125 [Botryotinia globosa]|nr:hypothetical protein EAF00_011125 [Botryotinia globosa]
MSKYLAGSCERVVNESDDQGLVTLFCRWYHSDSISGIETNGFKSHVRQSTLEFGNHESYVYHSKNCAYHGLILMENAIVELGEDIAANTEMHLGLDGHVATLPVDRGETMNVVAFTVTKEGWADPHRLARAAAEQDTLNELTSSKRKVSIGDAAHSTSPHQGSGGSFANEDSAVLAELLVTPAVNAHNGLRAMFQAFKLCRSPRTQRPVAGSRPNGRPDEWQAEDVGVDTEKIAAEAYERYEKIAGTNRSCSQS